MTAKLTNEYAASPRERVKELRRDSEEYLRTLFGAMPDGVFLKDAQGRWLAVNTPGLELFELENVDYWGKTDCELAAYSPFHADALRRCDESDEQAWRAGKLVQGEELIPRRDGTVGVYAVLKIPLFHADGSRKGLVVIARNITLRNRAESERDRLLAQELGARAAAENAERRARLLAEASRHLAATMQYEVALREVVQLVVPFAADACFVDLRRANAALDRVAVAAVDPSWMDSLGAADVAVLERARSVALSGNGAVIIHEPEDDATGEPTVIRDVLVAPIRARERVLGALTFVSATPKRYESAARALCEDLAQRISLSIDNARLFSELKDSHDALARAQEELVRRERLAALGELAAVVAHEVRNPLGAIFNSLGSLRKMLELNGDAGLLFGVVEEEASRLNRIVVELLDFVRPFRPTLEPYPLAEVVDEALATTIRANPNAERVRVSRSVDPALVDVVLDPQLMHVALSNIISNALQAMPEGGELSVTAQPVQVEGRSWAQVSVSDTGRGIPAEALTKVFEPFFTTRASGTGLGLAIVKRIVDSHMGQVEMTSTPGGGAAVVIRLPRAS